MVTSSLHAITSEETREVKDKHKKGRGEQRPMKQSREERQKCKEQKT